ncbi:MAG: hypothetical protein QW204_02160 [Thermoplasmata archaeon]
MGLLITYRRHKVPLIFFFSSPNPMNCYIWILVVHYVREKTKNFPYLHFKPEIAR